MPSIATDAVLMRTKLIASEKQSSHSCIENYSSTEVNGYDFNEGINHSALLQTYLTTGFQATNFGLAIQQIQQMVHIFIHFKYNIKL